MNVAWIAAACALILLIAGCVTPLNPGNGTVAQVSGNATSGSNVSQPPPAYLNANARSFTNFTDPREGAFSLEVPAGWAVANGSGIIRPYIDAGVAFEANSASGQHFFFQEPFGYMYTTPNQVLDYAGFTEGSLYDPSGGIAQPMVVRSYATASDFASELLAKSGLDASNVGIVERPDLLLPGNAMISRQSAAELAFDYENSGKKMKSVVLVRTVLVEVSGTGIWYVSLMEYAAPAGLMNETELLALNMQRSFKVDPAWALREQAEVRKRLGIIAQNQADISETISSTFEMRSRSMDEINRKWDNYILGVEDVYNLETGSHYVVDSGWKYYWADNQGNVYGTDTAGSPFPSQDLHQLDCPKC